MSKRTTARALWKDTRICPLCFAPPARKSRTPVIRSRCMHVLNRMATILTPAALALRLYIVPNDRSREILAQPHPPWCGLGNQREHYSDNCTWDRNPALLKSDKAADPSMLRGANFMTTYWRPLQAVLLHRLATSEHVTASPDGADACVIDFTAASRAANGRCAHRWHVACDTAHPCRWR